MAEMERKHIGGEARPAAIAVRIRMDGDELVVKAHGDLVGRIRLVLHPIAHVIERLAERRL